MTIKKIKRIFLLLAFVSTTLSCGKALLVSSDSDGLNGKTGKLIISGVVTDSSDNKPLEDIIISFQCDAENFEKINAHTNSEGIFIISAKGFKTPVTGCVTVRDPEDKFHQITRDIKVNWQGNSYDPETGLFAINDCNFQLKEK